MDATLSLGTPRMNTSGILLEGIALWSELKPVQSVDDIIARALRHCDLAVSMGLGAIRSHVDVCDDALKGVQALHEVRKQVAPYLVPRPAAWSPSRRMACCATPRRCKS